MCDAPRSLAETWPASPSQAPPLPLWQPCAVARVWSVSISPPVSPTGAGSRLASPGPCSSPSTWHTGIQERPAAGWAGSQGGRSGASRSFAGRRPAWRVGPASTPDDFPGGGG